MFLRDISFHSPEENILFDEVLFYLAEKEMKGEYLRFWESPMTFVVLGRISAWEDDVYIKKVKRYRIPVLRRFSGGGTVLQGRGCLNYTLVLSKRLHPELNDLRKSYEFILGKIIKALKRIGIEAVFYPISDLALKETKTKFSGNAQKRGKNAILHHGTILYCFEKELMKRFLKIPKSTPEYRKGRSHDNFTDNVPCSRLALKKAIRKEWQATNENNSLTPREEGLLGAFKKSKKIFIDL